MPAPSWLDGIDLASVTEVSTYVETFVVQPGSLISWKDRLEFLDVFQPARKICIPIDHVTVLRWIL